MAVLRVDAKLISSLDVTITFDDNTTKVAKITEGKVYIIDYAESTGSHTITGRIVSIGTITNDIRGGISMQSGMSEVKYAVTIDGSEAYKSKIVNVIITNIRDIQEVVGE